MSSNINFEMVCRKCIKPSSPTPSHLKIFKLSLIDQLSPNIHGNMTFFYPYNPTTHVSEFSTKSQLLQNSLSQTLTLFYPLAGRLQDLATIHCNDEGAFFIESQTNASLSDILTNPNFDTLQHLLPTTDNKANASLLLVRFTLFQCGGTAVTISLTHKLADIAALVTLLKSWTAACGGVRIIESNSTLKPSSRGGDNEALIPKLAIGATLFPPREIPNMSATTNITTAVKFTTRRFVFYALKIEELNRKVKSALHEDLVFQPSRVEVVLALIWKCALLASRSKTASFKPSVLFQAVNLRPRMVPIVPDTAFGNFVWPFTVKVEKDNDLELHELVSKMRESSMEFLDTKVDKFKEEGAFRVVMEGLKERGELLKNNNKEILVYKCSSWCKFPLLETDFGWGKPVWMCSVNKMVSNTIAMMDTRDGGVEACVTLDEEKMGLFEQNGELLHYAMLNPSVII